MATKPNYYGKALQLLQQLQKKYPTYSLGKHLSTALADYGDVWSVSDKEILFALEKYNTNLELDIAPQEDDLEKIIADGMDLEHILDDDSDDEDEDF